MGSPTMYSFCPEDHFRGEPLIESNVCTFGVKKERVQHSHTGAFNRCAIIDLLQFWTLIFAEIHVTRNSSSSSTCPSPASSSCEEYEESDTEFHSETSKRKIKRKLRARDRDQEIEFLLKRRSLVLQRLSSNASSNASSNGSSSKSVTFLNNNDEETDYNNPSTKRSLSRQTSNTSAKSVRFCDNGELNCQQQQPKRILSRQSSNASILSSRLPFGEAASNQLRNKILRRQSSVSSMNSESSNCSLSSSSTRDRKSVV